MQNLPFAEILAEREAHFGPTQNPPTPTTTPALIEYLHTLNALRIHLIQHIDTVLEAARGYLGEAATAELVAVRTGADASEAKQRWQLISFSWRRWVSKQL